jgi:hypothetical protein
MVDKVESFQDRNSVGAWGSSLTSFQSALGKALGKGVSVVLIGVVLGSLGVVGGPRGEVLDVPASVFGSCWFVLSRASETYRLRRVLGIAEGGIEGWMRIVVVKGRGEKGSNRRSGETREVEDGHGTRPLHDAKLVHCLEYSSTPRTP